MSKVDWSKVPKDAQFYSFGHFRKHEGGSVEGFFYNGAWVSSEYIKLEAHIGAHDFEFKPILLGLEIKEQKEAALDGVAKTLSERQSVYGDFADVSDATQNMEDILKGLPSYNKSSADKREAAHMILQKLARAFSGDPDYTDSWHDIQGYAKLVEDRLK